MITDFKYALRMLIKTPAFTFIAILTLALGIGANSAIFSVVDAVLLRPLPYAKSQELVRIYGTQPQLEQAPMAPANFLEWKERNQVFARIATYVGQGFTLLGGDRPERVRGMRVSADLFQVLGTGPIIGRGFNEEEDAVGRNRVVVVSDEFWNTRLGGSRQALGQTIILNGDGYTVVGVMPPGFAFPDARVQLWTPVAFSNSERATRDTNYINVIARLKPGVSVQSAQDQLGAIARQQAQEHQETNNGIGVKVLLLRDDLLGNVRPVFAVLFAAVAFVLLIACANVANLLLARASERQKEMSIRSALGASRARVLRLLLSESLVIALAGAALGLLFAVWGVELLVALKPANLPRLHEIHVDRAVFAFTGLLALLTGVVFGLFSAWHASGPDLSAALKESGRGMSGGRRRQTVRRLLVVAEVAMSLVLLIGAGLMIRSFARLLAVDPGFNPHNVLTAFISLPVAKYSDEKQQATFFQRLIEETANLPGVTAAAVVSDLPLFGGNSTGFDIEGVASPERRPLVDYRSISADYFRAMNIHLIKGRAFSAQDNANAPHVAIINETFAAHFFPKENPIGRRIRLSGPPDVREIVGMVADVRNYGLDAEVKPEAYVPFLQNAPDYLAGVASAMNIVMRSANDPLSQAPALRTQVQKIDKDQPVSNLSTMETSLADSVGERRFNMALLAIFASVALVLAAVGIYGVISYTVTQRSQEMGIRLALGASARDILLLVFGHSLATTLTGIALGLAAAFPLTRLMRSLLYEIAPGDPLIFICLTTLLLLVALIATYIPARRAMKVDPLAALRHE